MTRWISAVALLSIVAAQPAPDKPTVDLSGTWVLDKEISVDLLKVTLTPVASDNGSDQQQQVRNRRAGSGGFGRGGFGGGGFGGGSGGSRQRSQNEAVKLTAEEQARLKALAGDLKTGWAKLVVSQHDQTLVINDEKDWTYFLKTDGSAADNHVGTFTLSSTTRVDGDHMVTEWPLGSRLIVVYSYAPLTNGKQMVVRVTYKDSQDAHDTRRFDPNVYLMYKKSGA